MVIFVYPDDLKDGELSRDRAVWEKLSVNDFRCLNKQTVEFAYTIKYIQQPYYKTLKSRDGFMDNKYPDPIIGQEIR